jgi:hypothetical protein
MTGQKNMKMKPDRESSVDTARAVILWTNLSRNIVTLETFRQKNEGQKNKKMKHDHESSADTARVVILWANLSTNTMTLETLRQKNKGQKDSRSGQNERR